MKEQFNRSRLTHVDKEMFHPKKPVMDPDKGMINPVKLVISKDTMTKLKGENQ